MADKTIIVKIEAIVNNLSSKLKQVTGDLDKFARSNNVLSKAFGLSNSKQQESLKVLKSMNDGQKAVAKSFLELGNSAKSAATKYAKLDDAQKKVGDSYYKLSNAIRSGSQKAIGAQAAIINQWKAMPSHVRGAVTAFHNQNAATQQTIKGFAGLGQSMRSAITHFSTFPQKLQQSRTGILNFSKSFGTMAKSAVATEKLKSGLLNIGKAIFSFSNATRTVTSASRAVGTSMIFAGGAFRQLGVGINVAASVLQSFLPAISGVVSGIGEAAAALGPYALLLVPVIAGIVAFVANLVVAVAELGVAAAALYAIADAGIEFNRIMETTQISIATLTTQFKDLYDAQGVQIGAMKEYSSAQLMSMSADERAAVARQQSIAVNEKLTASLGDAKQAFLTLTVEAAQSPYTTSQLAGGFQAVVASLGQYNISTKQAAQLTVTLGRVAAVAGVSAGSLASQFTLFLTGAGRITSPLSRFAAQVGLTKQKMLELREAFKQAKGDPEKSAAIMSVLTTKLQAFDEAGRRVANSWTGIMSNMTEAFELFAGSVTGELFNKIRDGLFNVKNVEKNGQQVVDIYNEDGKIIREELAKNADEFQADFNKSIKNLGKESAKARKEVVGLLSQIFNYDENGALPTNINRVADLFTERFQPLILIIEDLFTLIGTDIAGALESVTGIVDGVSTAFEENQGYVEEIYGYLKLTGEVIWDFVVGLGKVFGITGAISDTTSTLQQVVIIISATLGTVLIVVHAIAIVVEAIIAILKGVGLALVAIGDTVYQLIKAGALLAQGKWSEAWDSLTNGWSATKAVFDSMMVSIQAIVNQGKAMGDVFNNTMKIGDKMAKLEKTRVATTKKNVAANKELISTYTDLARTGNLYKDGKLTKVLHEGEKFKYDAKTDTTSVINAKGETIGRKTGTISAEEAAKMSPAAAQSLYRSELARNKSQISTKPRADADAEDAKKNEEKKGRIVAELQKRAFKEYNSVLEAELDKQSAMVQRQFDLVSAALSTAANKLSDEFARGSISFLESITKGNSLTVQGIQAEIQKENELENLRQSHYAIDIDNLKKESAEQDEQYQRDIEAAKENKKSAVELKNIDIKYAFEKEKSRLKLAEMEQKSYAERINYLTKISLLETKISDEVQKANQEIFMGLRAHFDELAGIQAEVDTAFASTGFENRDYNIELQARDRIAKSLTFQKSIQDRISVLTKEDAVANASKIRSLQLLDTLNKQSIENQVKLVDLEKASARVSQFQLDIENKKFAFDKEEERIQDRIRRGTISTTQAVELTADAAERYQKSIQETLQHLADGVAYYKSIHKEAEAISLQKTIDELLKMNEVLDEGAKTMRDTFRTGFETFFDDIQSNIGDIGTAFTNLGTSILKTFHNMISKRLSEKLFDSLFGNGLDPKDPNYKKGLFGDVSGMFSRGAGNKSRPPATAPVGVAGDFLGESTTPSQWGKILDPEFKALELTVEEVKKASILGLDAIKDLVPQIGEAFRTVVESLNEAAKQIPGYQAALNAAGMPRSEQIYSTGSISDLIASKESFGGNYGAFNTVKRGKDGKLVVDKSGINSNMVNMTIGQIMSMQSSGNFNAVGKYQFIPSTLREVFAKSGLKSSDKFNSATQEKLFNTFLSTDAGLRPVADFISGKSDNINAAVDALSSKWGAIQASNGVGKLDGSLNKANIKPEQTRQALLNTRRARLGGGVQRNDGLSGGLLGSEITPIAGTTTGETVPVSGTVTVGGISTQAAQVIADPQNTQNQTKQNTPLADNGDSLITNIATQVGDIALAVSEGGILGLIRSLDGKIWTGLQAELDIFLGKLQNMLTLSVVTPIVNAISASATKELIKTTADNISTHISGKKATYAAYGGYISGPGGPTDDKIPAWLSNGEFVVKAAAVKALGIDNLHKINNADKEFPKFGFGGFVSGIFKNIGKFLKTDAGKLVLGTVIPMVAQKFLGEKAASAISLALPFLFNLKGKGGSKKPDATKQITDLTLNPTSGKAAFESQFFKQTPRLKAAGGLIGRFAKGGLAKSPFGTFAGKPKFIGGIPAAEGGFWSSANGQAIKGGAVSAALSIGMALLGRWQANKAWKKQLEEYKKNRTPDPYGMNPETLTFYKKPIITGSRNWLAQGGMPTPQGMLKTMPHFAMGGGMDINLDEILSNVQGGDNPMNITQNINITTPDVHSFRNSRGQLERDLARVTQRGLKRRAPKY